MTTADVISEFEGWIDPHLLSGKNLTDVMGAYTRVFPGRTVLLVQALYEKLNSVESQINKEALDGSN